MASLRTQLANDRDSLLLEEQPRFGVYYHRYEPVFYTGFAPRTNDPRRIHLHLGRGNQLRTTVVLADDVLREYAQDLSNRRRTYRALIEDGRLTLTQNQGFEEFERALKDAHVEQLASTQATVSDDAVRDRNLRLMEQLNPGRIFHIQMPLEEVVRRWVAQIQPADRAGMDCGRQLELVNLMLPTRLFVSELDHDTTAQLVALVKLSPQGLSDTGPLAAVTKQFASLFARVTNGMYPVQNGVLRFDEFTAIYPVGTLNAYTTYHG